MKKFASILVSVICILAPWTLYGCSKKIPTQQKPIDTIFQGKYKTLSEEELSAYAKQTSPFSIETLFQTQNGLLLRETSTFAYNAKNGSVDGKGSMKIVKNEAGSAQVEYSVRQTNEKGKTTSSYALYDDMQYTYTQEENGSGQTTKRAIASLGLAKYTTFSKMGYSSIHTVADDVPFLYSLNAVALAKSTLQAESDEKIEITKEGMAQAADENYVKIRLELAYEKEELEQGEKELSTATISLYFVYERQTNTPVAYHCSFYTSEREGKRTTVRGMSFSISPFEGTITPPKDLDRYSK